jgi:hypothetical protein
MNSFRHYFLASLHKQLINFLRALFSIFIQVRFTVSITLSDSFYLFETLSAFAFFPNFQVQFIHFIEFCVYRYFNTCQNPTIYGVER